MTPKHRLILAILLIFTSCQTPAFAQSRADNITPKPVEVVKTGKELVTVTAKTQIIADAGFADQATYLEELIAAQCVMSLQVQSSSERKGGKYGYIRLVADSAAVNRAEMYILTASGKDITIKAKDTRGMVYGIQTLLQLLPLQKTATASIPAVTIKDYPRFAYRGMHLDVVRHMFPVSFIKKYIDYLAFHKFNTFHWHLTDDQGWRIEIESYPKLNTVGSWRDSTLIGHFNDVPARYDATRYGGFYTKNEVRDVIKYAATRGISIIPEIDIPGHSRATIAAYPEFSTKPDTTWNVATTWGMYNRQNNVLAPNPATFKFLETVFHEIADLFPSPYFHLGGDECSTMWWKADSASQNFIREHHLKDEKGLQTYFIEQVAGYLADKGKTVIGWHEILEGDLDTSAIVMDWAGNKQAIAAATRNHHVIMTPGKPLYFDNYQSKDPNDSLAIYGYNPLDAVYKYEPVPAELKNTALGKYILGAQGNVWTEYIGNPAKVEYMVFPRMTALSEALWTPKEKKNYEDFKRRLRTAIISRYNYWHSSYFKDFEKWTSEK